MGEAIGNPADDVADTATARPLVLLTGATGFLGRGRHEHSGAPWR